MAVVAVVAAVVVVAAVAAVAVVEAVVVEEAVIRRGRSISQPWPHRRCCHSGP
jgi:hypothetical protein